MARYIGETESKRRKAAQFWGIVNGLLDELSHRGVTVVACAGNRDTATENSRRMIKDTTADIMPPCHARDNESLIVVGGVDGRGRLWWGSVPGTEDCQVHVYAQGYKVDLHSLDSRDSIVRMSGTSFAAPQVVCSLSVNHLATATRVLLMPSRRSLHPGRPGSLFPRPSGLRGATRIQRGGC